MEDDVSGARPARIFIYPAPPESRGGRGVRFTLGTLLGILWSEKLLIGAVAFACAVIFYLISFLVPVNYTATAIYAPASRPNASGGGLASLLPGTLGGIGSLLSGDSSNVQHLAALVKSRPITLKAVQDENALPVLFSGRWDAKAGGWKVGGGFLGFGSGAAKPPSENDILEKFGSIRTVSADPVTNLITVTVTAENAQMAAQLANRLAYYANNYERNRTRGEAESSIAFLNQRLQQPTSAAMHDSLANLLEQQLQTATVINARKDYVIQVLDPAVVPELKSSPRRSLYAALGFLLGMSITAGFGVFFWLRRERSGAIN